MATMRDRFKKRAQEGATGGFSVNLPEGVQRFSPKKGTYRLDVIPYVVSASRHPDGVKEGDIWCRRPFLIHFGVGVDNKRQICPRTVGSPCPICEYYERERRRPGADEDALKEIRAKARELYNVIDLNDKEAGIQVFEMSYHLFGKQLEHEINEADDDDVAGFAELKDGKTIKVRFSEASMGVNKFLEATRIDFLDRSDYKKSILDEVVNLDEVFNILSYEDLEAMFLEDEGAHMEIADEDDDEAPVPPKKKSRKAAVVEDVQDDEEDDEEDDEAPKTRRAKKSVSWDDEDDEDEESEEDEEDDEEEEAPKTRRAKAKVKKAVVDEDDEDDEDFEDDEEEAPKPKPKTKKATPKTKKAKSKDNDGECPLSNGTFGKDFNKFDECDDCDVWSECGKAKRAR